MTKADFEKLEKELRNVSDNLIRIDEKMNSMKDELKKGNEKFADHEERLRTIEEFKTEIRTKVVVYSSIISVVVGGIVALLIKIL